MSCHGQHRRDADAAGDEDVTEPALSQLKIVAWRGYGYDRADLQIFVNSFRSPASVILELDGNRVGGVVVWISAKRVLPHFPVRKMQIDMGACDGGGRWARRG